MTRAPTRDELGLPIPGPILVTLDQYRDMTLEERAAFDSWIRHHHINPLQVPVPMLVDYDPATDEWRFPIHLHRDGRPYLTEHDEIAAAVVRRRRRFDPPPGYGAP